MVRLAQLVFSLSFMFAAFLGGLTVGWLRWGRRSENDNTATVRSVPRPEPANPRSVNRELFSPGGEGGEVIDLGDGPFMPAELAPMRTDAPDGHLR